jgi:hypothetical protein
VSYEKPEIVDYGSIEDLTAQLGPGGDPDGSYPRHTTAPAN